jgi:acetyl esterase/lipase
MRITRKSRPGLIAAIVALGAVCAGAAGPTVDDAFRKFWDAQNVGDATKAAAGVVDSRVAFADALKRLKAGRVYSANVPRGIVHQRLRVDGQELFYDVNVPVGYDPSRRYQVRFQLHGGVMGRETNMPRGDGSIGALAGAEQIYVIPYAWTEAPWWSDVQIDSFRGILDRVKRTYNVDENRVVVAGVSDGATAAYYVAMRDTTPFASFLPLNGFLLVLSNPDLQAGPELFPNNLLNKPFFVVNGGMDPLYPMRIVEPYINHLMNGGVMIEYHPQPDAGHNTKWWPEMKEPFEAFVSAHPRDPLPETLTWESTGSPRSNRAHWLIIDQIGKGGAHSSVRDLNDFVRPGQGADGRPLAAAELFKHPSPFGRVDLVRRDNVVELTTDNVIKATLLLSPDAFDFDKPVKVSVNGRTLFEGRVEPSAATLMKWAARDNDRTMLFGAELTLTVPR